MTQRLDVIIVGAGAAGIGMGVTLKDMGVRCYRILDRHRVGASFMQWPDEMRFISPSFTANQFGLLDLNAVTWNSSPAFTLGSEHPTGKEYASYLCALAKHYALPISTGIDVERVTPGTTGFRLDTSQGPIETRFVIWAAGEFQYPRLATFAGASLCLHSSQVKAWADLQGDQFIVIGGYESSLDAAINLVRYGKRVSVMEVSPRWDSRSSDPSATLSPYTRERLADAS